jgi:hypothetical protein
MILYLCGRMSSKSLPIPRRVGPWAAVVAVAIALAGCGGAVRVQPNAPAGSGALASRGKVDSPLTDMHDRVVCLQADHLTVQVLGPTRLQIGAAAPAGPTIVFTPTAGAAQAQQIDGNAQGAEAIGSALLYPNQGSASELTSIEDCLDQGVQG